MNTADVGHEGFRGDGVVGVDNHAGGGKWEQSGIVPRRQLWLPVSFVSFQFARIRGVGGRSRVCFVLLDAGAVPDLEFA